MKLIGVDGCRGGWFAVTLFSDNENYEINVYKDFADLVKKNEDANLILVDIPIGLPYNGPRQCDLDARRVLGPPRASSVFPTPCREAAYAESYKEACDLNFKTLGKRIPIQSWAISSKICEVDNYLLKNPQLKGIIWEAHPEICFWSLAARNSMNFNKKKLNGINERLEILSLRSPKTNQIYNEALVKYLRKEVARDDIIDAIVLAITANNWTNINTLPKIPVKDMLGLKMEIVYPN